MSARLLIDARLHVSFSFPFLFSFPFTLYRKLEKYTHSFDRNIIRRDRCSLKLQGNKKKIIAIPGKSSELIVNKMKQK